MVSITSHGGSCCGIRHINSFGYGRNSVDHDLREVRRIIRNEVYHCRGHLLEAVLNSDQVNYGRGKGLLEIGFKLVNKFRNPTGRMCYVFHYCESVSKAKHRGLGVHPLVTTPSPPVTD